jgi:putative membrane protein
MKLSKVSTYVLGAVVALPLSLAAQNPPSQIPGQPVNGVPDSSMNGGGGVDTQAVKDKMFVRKATEGGYATAQFGQLAVTKSGNADVKSYGQRVIDDHATYNKELMSVADQMGVRAPSKLDKENKVEYDKLSALSGSDFDKEFLIYMMTSHRKDLRDFRTEEDATADPALKDVVTDGEKVIVGHLKTAYTLAKANGITVQRPGGAPAGPPK